MPNFDRTVDNRWRPDLESSQRRVREEESDHVSASRELSFVPARRKVFEPYNAQTRALIRRLTELERLPHGSKINELLMDWSWLERMHSPEEKQRFLEKSIAPVQRDPVANEHRLVFLMLVFEPVRRSVGKAFVNAQAGLHPAPRDVNWSNRSEARMIRQVERERLFDVTREAALEAVFRYPTTPPARFFLWLRETIAHRALDALRAELPETDVIQERPAEAEAVQRALAGLDQLEGPAMRDRAGMRAWRRRIRMRDVFDVVEQFFEYDGVREACQQAVGRLPRAERRVINGYFFEELDIAAIAARSNTAHSTVYNQKAKAQRRLHEDDVFFASLYALGAVRDEARARETAARYPDGYLPDGRRIVVIDSRAA